MPKRKNTLVAAVVPARPASRQRGTDLGYRLGPNLFGQRPGVVAVVERVQPKRVGGSSRPQPQRIDPPAAPSDGGCVVGHCLDGFRRVPDMPHRRFRNRHRLDRAAEADWITDFRPMEFPGIAEGQPVFGEFLLPAVLHHLAEQSVLVTDAIAMSRNIQRGHALHVTRRKPAQAAVAQRGVGFQGTQPIEIDSRPASAARMVFSVLRLFRLSNSRRPIRNSSDM